MNTFIETFASVYVHFLQQYGGVFHDTGVLLYKDIAICILVWFGIMTAMNSSEFMGGFRWGAFIKLLFLIATCNYLIYHYSSFLGFMNGMSSDLASRLQSNLSNNFFMPLTNLLHGLEKPNPFNVTLSLIYVVLYVLMAVLKAVIFYVIAFGFLAQGVIVILGPIFIPLLMVPKLDFIFWGWLKALIQYAFYPVVANAFLYVMGSLITSQAIYSNLSGSEMISSGIPILTLFLVAIFSIFKIPTLVNHIFSGLSGIGGSVIPFTGGK